MILTGRGSSLLKDRRTFRLSILFIVNHRGIQHAQTTVYTQFMVYVPQGLHSPLSDLGSGDLPLVQYEGRTRKTPQVIDKIDGSSSSTSIQNSHFYRLLVHKSLNGKHYSQIFFLFTLLSVLPFISLLRSIVNSKNFSYNIRVLTRPLIISFGNDWCPCYLTISCLVFLCIQLLLIIYCKCTENVKDQNVKDQTTI